MKMYAKIFVVAFLISLCFVTQLEAGRGGGGRPRPSPEPCENCFAENTCLGGDDNVTLTDDCAACLRQECEYEFNNSLSSSFGIDCMVEAVAGNCSDDCDSDWNPSNETVANCEGCIKNCLSKKPFRPFFGCTNFTRPTRFPCASCVTNGDCFNRTEIQELFSPFCLGYVYLACAENATDECIMEALMSDCSQCNPGDTTVNRLQTCATCQSNCAGEGNCINQCRSVDTYPSEVPCGYCSLFCTLEGRTRRNPRHWRPSFSQSDSSCDNLSEVCPACNTCNDCVDQCRAAFDGDFEHSNFCACTEESVPNRYENRLEFVGLRSIFLSGRYFYGDLW